MDYLNMSRVLLTLQSLRVKQDLVSPNYVNDLANSIGVSLTSEEVVRISDDYVEVE